MFLYYVTIHMHEVFCGICFQHFDYLKMVSKNRERLRIKYRRDQNVGLWDL